MNNLKASYNKILKTLNFIEKNNFLVQIRKPKRSDKEVVSLVLVAELLIERSVYNRRKRKLFPFIEAIRKKISRKNRIKICKENFHTAPNEGFCTSQQTRYYGYKLHAVCTIQDVFRSFDLSKASVHDIHYLNDVRSQYENTVLLGDKGYLSQGIADRFVQLSSFGT